MAELIETTPPPSPAPPRTFTLKLDDVERRALAAHLGATNGRQDREAIEQFGRGLDPELGAVALYKVFRLLRDAD